MTPTQALVPAVFALPGASIIFWSCVLRPSQIPPCTFPSPMKSHRQDMAQNSSVLTFDNSLVLVDVMAAGRLVRCVVGLCGTQCNFCLRPPGSPRDPACNRPLQTVSQSVGQREEVLASTGRPEARSTDHL